MTDRRYLRRLSSQLTAVSLGFGAAMVTQEGLTASLGWPVTLFIVAICLGIAGHTAHKPGGVPVVVYHSVSRDASWLPWARNTSVRPEVFLRHMEVLRRKRWTVFSREAFEAARARGLTIPRKSVMIHFDDGYLDNWMTAVPIMRRYGTPAVFFASADFIDPSTGLRPTMYEGATDWRGYMNADELREVDADPLFEVACHGADHARVPVAGDPVATLTPENWRSHAPLWWLGQGDKSRWFGEPMPAPEGTPVPPSDSALTSPALVDGQPETRAAFEARVRASLIRARHRLEAVLGRNVDFLCWPFDRVTNQSAAIAREVGFATLTGGRGENRETEDPLFLSRTHINDFAAGPAPLWVEGLVFRAKIGVAAGNYWWIPVTTWAKRRRARHFTPPVGPGA